MLEDVRTVYVSTPKVACSSLKTVVAGLGGEDVGRLRRIHQRELWERVPTLHDLDDDRLAAIDGDAGWHVFAVVRDPVTRLWSAWQEKLLLRIPRMVERTPAHLVPPVPDTPEDVVRSFQRFVAAFADGDGGELRRDPHFAPQARVLAAGRMPYTRVYRLSELGQAMRDLERQASAYGGGPVPPLPHSNSTPLRPPREAFDEATLAGIGAIYRKDFRHWFPDGPQPTGEPAAEQYTEEALAWVRDRVASRGT